MTRKDYEAIAREFNDQVSALRVFLAHNDQDLMAKAQLVAVECMADRLARVFAQDNPRFDRQKFGKACGF